MPYKDQDKAKQYAKEYREKKKEKNKLYQQVYRQQNVEKLRMYKEVWYKSKRGDKLLKSYGISLDDYHNMLKQQNGHCAICDIEFSETVRPYVDHCHITSKVRGLLCMNCNTGLGHFKDNTKYLLKAARYVK